MNWDRIEGNWKQLKGKAREKWGKLTDSDWDQVAGKKDQLIGRIQERCGFSKKEAKRKAEQGGHTQSMEAHREREHAGTCIYRSPALPLAVQLDGLFLDW